MHQRLGMQHVSAFKQSTQKIQNENSDVKKLNQIAGKENIADLESRRMYFEDFKIDQVRD